MTSVLYDVPGPRARRRALIASIITGIALAGALAWVIVTLTGEGLFDADRWDVFRDPVVWGALGGALLVTLQVAAIASVLAVLLGSVFALLRLSRLKVVRVPTTVVLEFLRGMPVLLMMFFILIMFATSQYWAVVMGLALYNGAIIGEALRAGIVALPKGQREAGLALGMTPLLTRLLVEFPQAFRAMTPIIVAQLVVLLKDSSLGYIVGLEELVRRQRTLAEFYGFSQYGFSFFVITLFAFLIVNLVLSMLARRLASRDPAGRASRRAARKTTGENADTTAIASIRTRRSEAQPPVAPPSDHGGGDGGN
ncbi:amino acid ABC transporter membrane protein 2 (PAAT family) [Microcella alkaliphila]|uniref:Amino acid ABC transporter membrane protein 2 (PAAT family) n=2 Tax=Microcella TaxID=337004 RepID=A0A4Q7LUQ9_9MICO|nr:MULTISPECIES: amino acid ABC transporter permease [Microcella]RZS57678.1 amino acid ABC transporter membrane protein 2 (PAAT family) [Microcella putealis]RZT62582.1 amino acid ABC transporter membrane protein 2 (PAAT family) [Microcella alkaliphila]TQM24745.1 amino acid ABC transporter membrane protein 2 (PAAT family) [Microcella putealis]